MKKETIHFFGGPADGHKEEFTAVVIFPHHYHLRVLVALRLRRAVYIRKNAQPQAEFLRFED